MKLFIAITLFVVVSALPRRNELVPQKDSPIVFRHWEPKPESHVRKHINDYIRIENILNALPFPSSRHPEANDSGDRKITPQDIINALNIIHQFLNNNGDDDDDESIIVINDGEDKNQSDLAPIGEGEVAHSDGPDSDDENIVNESQQSNNDANGQNVDSEDGDEIPIKHQNPDKNQPPQSENSPSNGENALIDVVQPEYEDLQEVGEDDSKDQRFVDFMPRPLENFSQYTPKFQQQQTN
ncbi:uncharacterized protein LOC126774873 [Nymphalis io]|uniref:uncharacterized protein LOC126774873 n=1 Tax=Inachis io TaxID=171585 RepID=UPI002168ADD5|nr:uncharacterized protein LOC126774873 [Nymphalis io]